MGRLNPFLFIIVCFGILAGIQTPQVMLIKLKNQFEVKSLEESLGETHQLSSSKNAAVQRSDTPNNNYNNAKQLQLSFHKRSNLPNPQVPAEESDPELQTFENQLTPEQQQLLKEPNPDEVSSVDVQTEKKSAIPLGAAREFSTNTHKRSNLPDPPVPDENSDPELQTFEQNLNPEQQQLLKKMKNKMKYLQAVLHEPAPEPVPNENPSTEVQVMEKKSALANDKNKNKLQLLKAVLNEPEQSANPEELQGKIFLEVNKKLNELKKSLETFRRNVLVGEHSKSTENEDNKVEKKCQACDCRDKQCNCDACNISVSGKISKRLVTGVKSGAMTGVNLKQLLSALSQVKANGHE
ncbi:hypothetical protein LSH36_27g03025 [Paralvinella palmiformis]|uniref:Uncharacterized protein n=1 Tax=Paralvinella palmiformis TaxID=53620 RepID=A0AAD9NG85_9ANNE|nr:hypothetical protein LSH36_27g03025 [Paralvinella palmiformis]